MVTPLRADRASKLHELRITTPPFVTTKSHNQEKVEKDGQTWLALGGNLLQGTSFLQILLSGVPHGILKKAPKLLNDLSKPNANLREKAAQALGAGIKSSYYTSPSTRKQLMALAKNAIKALYPLLRDKSPKVKIAVARALHAIAFVHPIQNASAKSALRVALGPKNLPDVRAESAYALSYSLDKTMAPWFIPLLKDKNPKVTKAGAHGIAWIASKSTNLLTNPSIIPALITLLSKTTDERAAAAHALGFVSMQQGMARFIKVRKGAPLWKKWNRSITYFLTAVPPLKRLLVDYPKHITKKDRSARVRMRAAIALGRIKDPHAILALARAMNTDSSALVISVAAVALAKIPHPRSLQELIKALSGKKSYVKNAAAKALKDYLKTNKSLLKQATKVRIINALRAAGFQP